MSEQEPLLATTSNNPDVEAANDDSPSSSTLSKWRTRVGEALEAKITHKIVIALIIIDATCVVIDLAYTLLSKGCEPAGPDAPLWLDILSEISTAITTFFLIEIPLALWAFGLSYYNPFGEEPHSSLHLFDAVIIVTTFVLEVALRGRERELASLLIILRLWRLVKLVGGVAVGAGELEDETIKELAEIKRELETTKSALSKAENENQKLRARLASLNAEEQDN
ncbi:uncharacterized protein STEHIDRAFT_137658 [Stereum hirsutum FP-91666 SS1]|uniref:uncharacterized protein n=1 Tax=Stereum hirsutum (strain FP-91666) TaxID=721885 RepID=UPI000440A6F8|nr:uncharacterized protein STEHIDRAFT_137658 [Stereum hirsutum FP-91666 SS1]EIM90134.1 hypothetical protein STEHIDRAFT_137658 [Stereum hirsutum FP-91666 SS1]